MPSRRSAPLTREQIFEAAVRLADGVGVEQMTIRRLADELGRKAMSLYHHVPSRSAILDGMVDRVYAEFLLPPEDLPWRAALRARCCSMREVLGRHPWATPLLDSRTQPGTATLGHHEATLSCLLEAGFSMGTTADAIAALDAFVFGFATQEAALPFTDGEDLGELATDILSQLPEDSFPSLRAFTGQHVLQPGYRFGASFEVGLDWVLDGIQDRLRKGPRSGGSLP